MKKRITSLLLVVVMVLTMSISASAVYTPFTDLAANAWYTSAVEWAYGHNVTSGTSTTTFSPGSPITRGMLVTMLYRLAGSPPVSGTSGFSDVASGLYYSNAITWAAKNNIVSGYGGNKFGPNDNISRQDIVVILYRYAGSPSFTKVDDFADMSSVSNYAKGAVRWAKSNGVVNGLGNNLFAPLANATRAEMVQILYKYFGHDYASKITKEPTCTTNGSRTYTCSVCGDGYTETIPATGHKYVSSVTKPATCSTPGIRTYTCSVCGHSYTEEISTLEAHTFTSKVTKEPTCTAAGVKTYTCSVCGYSYTESIPATGHNYTTKTVHHDAVTGTRDVTETWTHVTLYYDFKVTPLGLQEMPELANNAAGTHHVVKVLEAENPGATASNDPYNDSSVVWLYRYKNADDPCATLKMDVALGNYEYNGVNVTGYINSANYSSKTDKYTFEKVVGTETYVVTAAYDETITTCATCGATK